VAFSATGFWLNEKAGPLVRFTVKRDDAEPDAEEFWLNEIQAVLVTAATATAAKVCRRPNAAGLSRVRPPPPSMASARRVEADLGSVHYLATLLGAGDQDVLRWLILVVALLLDPAAVL
jgi:hypothetical protein